MIDCIKVGFLLHIQINLNVRIWKKSQVVRNLFHFDILGSFLFYSTSFMVKNLDYLDRSSLWSSFIIGAQELFDQNTKLSPSHFISRNVNDLRSIFGRILFWFSLHPSLIVDCTCLLILAIREIWFERH